MKRWLILAGITILAGAGVGGGCAYTTHWTARGIINNQLTINNWRYKTFKWCTNGLPFVDRIEKLLGGKYIILLQNNTELRASGGFVGSYAAISTDKTGIKQIYVQDIYEPDGKLPGHVEPPYPIQEAFGQGWWKLRDANWDPDFASAAGAVRWFMEQGGEREIEGIIGVNLGLVNQLIRIYGPIKLATYDEVITHENFYSLAQRYAETRTTGNKTDKRGFLGAVGVALEERIKSLKVIKSIKLMKLIFQELRKGEILVWMRDPEIQKEIEFRGWGGRLEAGWNPGDDYLYVVESNLGANKANCCIDRHVSVSVSGNRSNVELTWFNNNEFEHPKPPVFWGGNYIDYARIIVPRNAGIQRIRVGEKELRMATEMDFTGPNTLRHGRSEEIYAIEPRGDPSASSGQGLQIIGFWAVVEAGKSLKVEIEYQSDRVTKPQSILLKHQPGSGTTDYRVVVDGIIKTSGQLDRDEVFMLQ